MQRWIDIVEWKRKRKGMTIKDLCDGLCNPDMYPMYMKNDASPNIKIIDGFCRKLGLHHYLSDETITISIKPIQWALMRLYIEARPQESYLVYSRIFMQNFRPDNLFYMAMKLSLFITFVKMSNESPSRALIEDEIITQYEIPFLKNIAEERGMLNMISEPTELMYSFYEEMSKEVDNYLQNGNIRFRLDE